MRGVWPLGCVAGAVAGVLVNGISGKVGLARPEMDAIVDALATKLWEAPPEK